MYGAELHYLAATAQQVRLDCNTFRTTDSIFSFKCVICALTQSLGALAESAVANNDASTCAACAAEFVRAINQVRP